MATRLTGVVFTQSTTEPPSPALGDEWFNTTTSKLYKFVFYNNSTQWIETPSFASVPTPTWTTATRPTNPRSGLMGYNSDSRAIEAYVGVSWSAFIQGSTPTVEYLVVAGGGGGGANDAAGGGAGGFRTATGFAVSGGVPISVTVGAGGAGGINSTTGVNGSASVFASIVSTGGGYGGADANNQSTVDLARAPGGNGGSGGGGGGGTNSTTPAGGTGIAGQGNNGGAGGGNQATGYGGGGGGGAGAVGASTVSGGSGNGGVGLTSDITITATSVSSVLIGTGAKTFTVASGLSYTANQPIKISNSVTNYMLGTVTSYTTTSLVVNIDSVVGSGTFATWSIDYIYAGGGGGGSRTTRGTGGAGGGGAGSGTGGSVTGISGTANTGGGGGGAGNDHNAGQTGTGGTGGSGIVIIRYSDTYPVATAINAVYTLSGGYRIYKFTTSGFITF